MSDSSMQGRMKAFRSVQYKVNTNVDNGVEISDDDLPDKSVTKKQKRSDTPHKMSNEKQSTG